jgi:UDP-N-acetylglucosamine--N-acetylmuramyl-(pentapeptide) pyrophosphoryl-undecaprenol N-acetylglucosamine transferase
MKMKKIIFTGGGSAGHITPNLAIIEELKDFKIYYIGGDGLEKDIIKKYPNITYLEIPTVKLIRSFTYKNLQIPFKLISSIKKAKNLIKKINPDIIFSKGGFVSLPVCIAGSKLKIPVLTHESDITIGLANKIIAKKSKALLCSFKETALKYGKNAIHTGSPIRKSILKGNKNNLNNINNPHNLPCIMIVGGSLGAKAINEIIFKNIDTLTKKYIVIHIVGKNNLNEKLLNKNNYYQYEFIKNIEDYFDLSDVVISRAGSNTIFELLAICKPMILIPLPKSSSRGDQILNANNFERNKLAKVILQEELQINRLISNIDNILKNKEKIITHMKKEANTLGNEKILNLIYKYSQK